jgi:hypothetical protein
MKLSKPGTLAVADPHEQLIGRTVQLVGKNRNTSCLSQTILIRRAQERV